MAPSEDRTPRTRQAKTEAASSFLSLINPVFSTPPPLFSSLLSRPQQEAEGADPPAAARTEVKTADSRTQERCRCDNQP